MTDPQRCQARSRLSGGQCQLPAGHAGEHSAIERDPSELEDPSRLWLEPDPDQPPSLEEMLTDLRDLIEHCRAYGFARMADLLNVVRTRIELDRRTYERAEATLRDLPPLE